MTIYLKSNDMLDFWDSFLQDEYNGIPGNNLSNPSHSLLKPPWLTAMYLSRPVPSFLYLIYLLVMRTHRISSLGNINLIQHYRDNVII